MVPVQSCAQIAAAAAARRMSVEAYLREEKRRRWRRLNRATVAAPPPFDLPADFPADPPPEAEPAPPALLLLPPPRPPAGLRQRSPEERAAFIRSWACGLRWHAREQLRVWRHNRRVIDAFPACTESLAMFMRSRASDILHQTALRYRLSVADIISPSRRHIFRQPRFEACWRMRAECAISFPVIGLRFRRDHTSIMHAVSAYEGWRAAKARGEAVPGVEMELVL